MHLSIHLQTFSLYATILVLILNTRIQFCHMITLSLTQPSYIVLHQKLKLYGLFGLITVKLSKINTLVGYKMIRILLKRMLPTLAHITFKGRSTQECHNFSEAIEFTEKFNAEHNLIFQPQSKYV